MGNLAISPRHVFGCRDGRELSCERCAEALAHAFGVGAPHFQGRGVDAPKVAAGRVRAAGAP
eukprot:11202251-Lingulodinium_polyedra.AAC.1